jgi:hypothetical protein
MGARLIILIVLGAGLAMFYALRPPAAENAGIKEQDPTGEAAEIGKMLWRNDPPNCPKANIEPDLSLSWSVDPLDGKNRIYIELSESHEFYVQSFVLEFWYMPDAATECEDSPLCINVPLDVYIKAGEFYEGCADINDAELREIGGDMGNTDNWGGNIVDYSMTRACTENPPELLREDWDACK